jgi:hypothetical protein
MVSDEAPAQPANGTMQWVVVTTWQDGQATRMVFTTARVSNKAPMVEEDGEGPGRPNRRPRMRLFQYGAAGW